MGTMMEFWFILAYAVGTVFGAFIGFKIGIKFGADATIDELCENGFLKHRKISAKNVEIYKYDEDIV